MSGQASLQCDTDAGFSLLEIMIVLAIIAASMLAASSFANHAGRPPRVSEEAAHIARMASTASLRAVASGTTERLVIDVAGRTVTTGREAALYRLPPSLSMSVTSAEELVESENTAAIEFYPDGTSSGGEVRLGGDGNVTNVVRIHWLTGAVSTEIVR